MILYYTILYDIILYAYVTDCISLHLDIISKLWIF